MAEEEHGHGEEQSAQRSDTKIQVSFFDNSIDKHLKAIDTISKLCGEAYDIDSIEESQIHHLYSSLTFLREWKHYSYNPKTVRFNCETEKKTFLGEVNLPHFSSAAVPSLNKEEIYGDYTCSESRKDFIMHVGGSVLALDWCPRAHEKSHGRIKCEFVAVAAHPPDSYYHTMGALLMGRGVVQIWCILSISEDNEEKSVSLKKDACKDRSTPLKQPTGRSRKKQIEVSPDVMQDCTLLKRSRGRPKKNQTEECLNEDSAQPKRPRGRPRKKAIDGSLDNLDYSKQYDQPLAVQYPEDSSHLVHVEGVSENAEEHNVLKNKRKRQKSSTKALLASNLILDEQGRRLKTKVTSAVECPEDSLQLPAIEGVSKNAQEQNKRNDEAEKHSTTALSAGNSKPETTGRSRSLKSKLNFSDQSRQDSCQLLALEGALENTQGQNAQKEDREKQKSSNKALSICNSAETKEWPRKLKSKARSTAQEPKHSSQLPACEGVPQNTQEQTIQKDNGKRLKGSSKARSQCNSSAETTKRIRRKSNARTQAQCAGVHCASSSARNEVDQSFTVNHQIKENSVKDSAVGSRSLDNVAVHINSDSTSIPADVSLPRVMLCLAHDGKVAWDVKWRPCSGSESDSKCQHRMGYLAVLLGNGSLEVWDVPLPSAAKVIYSSSSREGMDPRFIRLKPVFKGSFAKNGETRSIPLTVEWSNSYPYDYLLAGCHDGTVALWKFLASSTSGDTRPLLCFSADTAAIRAVAWAPVESGEERADVIVTGGHGGLKFWDIHDPFRPLWELHPVPRFIYSLDWVPDPRCIILSFDDGTMRVLSMVKAAYDAHVNGQPTVGPKQLGMQCIYNFSSFAIWSVQVSRKTGMVAYCSADGTVCRFQLTAKAVEKDLSRNRAPHFMMGSLSKDEAAITVNIPLPDIPLALKKPAIVASDSQRSMRSLLESSQTRRANDKKATAAGAENHPSAPFDGDDPGLQSEPDETLAALKRRTNAKSKNAGKKKAGDNLALVCLGEEQDNDRKKVTGRAEVANEIEVIPPKIVAMHRVRWNMNEGSERWLCSGGAAGIVRCQDVVFSDTDKFLARKR